MPQQRASTSPARKARPEHGRGEFRLALIAASAGGIPALQDFLSKLPADFPIPIAIVLHRAQTRAPILANVLARKCPLAVKIAEQGEPLRPGTVFLAPAREHLVVRANQTAIGTGAVDRVLPLERIPAQLVKLVRPPRVSRKRAESAPASV